MKTKHPQPTRARTAVAGAAGAAFIFASPAAALADGPVPGLPGLPGPNDAVTKILAPQPLPTSGKPGDIGAFGTPFVEPTIGDVTTNKKCLDDAGPNGLERCKPAAGTNILLPNGKILYFDNLGGTENVKYSIVGEYGAVATNDESRLLDLGKDYAAPTWTLPSPPDGGANPNGESASQPLIPGAETTEPYNDGALFGAAQSFLPDGRLLVQGGTDYSLDPGVDGLPVGVVELSGLKQTRIYDPATNTFSQTGNTEKGRWYPTQLTLGNGETLVIGGVTKLIKPVYRDDLTQSGQNVLDTERYTPSTGTWSNEGVGGKKDLPLYPRMHLLPNGDAFFNASGQSFNPAGQSAGQGLWKFNKFYDPRTKTWREGDIPGLTDAVANKDGQLPSPLTSGFRGSMTSTMLPLEPDADGNYKKASFLTAGGVLFDSPGSYIPTADSRITDVDTGGPVEKQQTRATGPLTTGPRWFGSQVLLPTGDVMQFSGADKDEVLAPGTEVGRQQAEIFDHATERWRPAAVSPQVRTYHNSAVLLPTGEVLIGGHATISTLYLNNTTLPGGFAPHDGRDPSFEIYKPPYLLNGAPRPVIVNTVENMGYGETFKLTLAPGFDASGVDSVRLVRNTAITHIVDADQRTVVLPVVARDGQTITVKSPPNGDVAPAGPYMLFVNGKTAQGVVPSMAKELLVGTPEQRSGAAKGGGSLPRATCISRRSFSVRVRRQYRRNVLRASFTVDGKRTLKRTAPKDAGKALGAPVTLRGKKPGPVTVKIAMRMKNGKLIRDVRRYKLCAKRIPGRPNFPAESSSSAAPKKSSGSAAEQG